MAECETQFLNPQAFMWHSAIHVMTRIACCIRVLSWPATWIFNFISRHLTQSRWFECQISHHIPGPYLCNGDRTKPNCLRSGLCSVSCHCIFAYSWWISIYFPAQLRSISTSRMSGSMKAFENFDSWRISWAWIIYLLFVWAFQFIVFALMERGHPKLSFVRFLRDFNLLCHCGSNPIQKVSFRNLRRTAQSLTPISHWRNFREYGEADLLTTLKNWRDHTCKMLTRCRPLQLPWTGIESKDFLFEIRMLPPEGENLIFHIKRSQRTMALHLRCFL
jgi:hypothetical protein